jgi:hypothetical protein
MSAVFVFAIISVRHAEVIIALAGVLYFLFCFPPLDWQRRLLGLTLPG